MPGLLLDDGAFQLLAVPSRTTIGRGAGNDVQPDSQSISKNHAAIEISLRRGQMVTTIEDFDSRNGTFVGSDTLEMERVKGKREIQYGHYLRFGNGGKFFRYLEEAPRDAVIVDPSEPGESVPPTTRSLKGSRRSESPSPARNPSSSLAIDVTSADAALAAPHETRLVKSLPDFSSPAAENFRYAQPPQEDVKAMTISIQYPTAGRQPLQPVTISIDPSSQQQQQRQSSQGHPSYHRPASRVSELEEHPPASSVYGALGAGGGGGGDGEEDAAVKEDDAAWDEARLLDAHGLERLPPPLSSDWEPPLSVAKGSLPPLHPGGISRDGRQTAPAPAPSRSSSSQQHRASRPQSHSQSPPRSLSPARARPGSAYQAAQPAPDKPLAKLVRRLFLPVDALRMPALADSVLEKMVGLPGDSPPRARADAPLPQLTGPVPEYLLAEAAADRFQDSDTSVCGQLGGVISDLSDLFRQAVAGAQIVGGDASGTSAELDSALLGVITTILSDSIETLQGVCYGSLVQAFHDAQNDGCENGVKAMLERSLARLDKLRLFVNKDFCKELCDAEGMTTAEMYCISALGLDFVLSDLDSANATLWGVSSKLDLPRSLPVAPPAEEGLRPSRGRASASASAAASAEGPVNKTALSCELDELRRLKSKAGARGASVAMAAQIALLEREKAAKEGSAGGRTGRGKAAGLQGAMDRLQQQEQVGGSREARVLRVLNTCDDALTRWQVHALLKWRHVVAAIKSNFASKLKRFGRLLQVRRLGMLARCFHRWDKTAALLRTDLLIEQETAKLKYEMCGMEARIHELSSGNALAASLAAERALNKELAGTNMELRLGVQELDARLLECANAPPASRKALVRDVFYGREDEIAHSRREAKTLREELQRLYDLGIEAVAERASQRILPRAPVPPEYRDKQERAAAPLRDRADRAAHPLLPPGSPPRSLSPTERPRPPPLALLQKGPQGRELPTMKKGGYPPPVMTKALTRADATMVIAQEVRRLASTVTALQEEREELRIKVRRPLLLALSPLFPLSLLFSPLCFPSGLLTFLPPSPPPRQSVTDSHANAQQSLAIQALQRRITDRERSQAALRALLQQRIGDKGLMELAVALEEMGLGHSALLKEVPVAADNRGGKGASFLPAIPKGRGNFRAAIDEGLAYAPSDDDDSGGE